MIETEVLLPKLGESIVSATVVRWLKAEGDSVALDEALLEVSTEKVTSEIPAPSAGVLKKIMVSEGERVDIGQLIAVIAKEEFSKFSNSLKIWSLRK